MKNVIAPTFETLEQLANLDEQFLNIYELGYSQKSALEKKVSLNPDSIEQLYKKNIKKMDVDANGHSTIGFNLSLWTGQSDSESSNISFRVGKDSDKISNSCLVRFPAEGFAKDRLLSFTKVKMIFDLLIDKWSPDIVVLASGKLSDKLLAITEVGWVTYKKQVAKKPKLKHNIIHESCYKGGHLFYLKTDNGLAYNYEMIDSLIDLKDSL